MAATQQKLQYLAGLSVCMGYVQAGTIIAWVSPAIVKLRQGEAGFNINLVEESWIVSLQVLCTVMGCVLGQQCVDGRGRRLAMLLAAPPALFSAALILWARGPGALYAARLLQGVSVGITSVTTIMYITEICGAAARGPLAMLGQVSLNAGYLLMYAAGPLLSYSALGAVLLAVPLVFMLAAYWVPESPYYYLRRGRLQDAHTVYMKLNGTTDHKAVEEQLSVMRAAVKQSMEHSSSMRELFTNAEYRRPLAIIAGLRVIQFLTGWVAITTYLQLIVGTNGALTPAMASILYGVLQLLASVAGSLLSRWVGRRVLLLTSCVGVCLSLTTAGGYFYLRTALATDHATSRVWGVLPLLGVLGFNVFYALGIGPLPNVLQAELFPVNVKSQASSAGTIFACILSFSVAKWYGAAVTQWGLHTPLWAFAAVAAAGAGFVYLLVPETRNKTLEEVTKELACVHEAQPLKSDAETATMT